MSGGHDALGRPAHDACAVTLINRSARPVEVYLPCDDVLGARELISDQDETATERAGAFSLRLPGMRGVTWFAQHTEKRLGD